MAMEPVKLDAMAVEVPYTVETSQSWPHQVTVIVTSAAVLCKEAGRISNCARTTTSQQPLLWLPIPVL